MNVYRVVVFKFAIKDKFAVTFDAVCDAKNMSLCGAVPDFNQSSVSLSRNGKGCMFSVFNLGQHVCWPLFTTAEEREVYVNRVLTDVYTVLHGFGWSKQEIGTSVFDPNNPKAYVAPKGSEYSSEYVIKKMGDGCGCPDCMKAKATKIGIHITGYDLPGDEPDCDDE